MLSIKALCALTAAVTGQEIKRSATKEAAEKRLIAALIERVGEKLAAESRRDILETSDAIKAGKMIEALIHQYEDDLLSAIETPIESAAPIFAGPGLARLRSHPQAEAIRLQVVEEAKAAERGEDPFKPRKRARKEASAPTETIEATPKAARVPRVKSAPDGKIVAVVANPKKPGSRAHARFELYRAGQSIADFLAACVASGFPESEARADISWDRRKGFITIA